MGYFLTGGIIGILVSMILTVDFLTFKYEVHEASVTKEECTIIKPAGTTCVYEGSWVAREVE